MKRDIAKLEEYTANINQLASGSTLVTFRSHVSSRLQNIPISWKTAAALIGTYSGFGIKETVYSYGRLWIPVCLGIIQLVLIAANIYVSVVWPESNVSDNIFRKSNVYFDSETVDFREFSVFPQLQYIIYTFVSTIMLVVYLEVDARLMPFILHYCYGLFSDEHQEESEQTKRKRKKALALFKVILVVIAGAFLFAAGEQFYLIYRFTKDVFIRMHSDVISFNLDWNSDSASCYGTCFTSLHSKADLVSMSSNVEQYCEWPSTSSDLSCLYFMFCSEDTIKARNWYMISSYDDCALYRMSDDKSIAGHFTSAGTSILAVIYGIYKLWKFIKTREIRQAQGRLPPPIPTTNNPEDVPSSSSVVFQDQPTNSPENGNDTSNTVAIPNLGTIRTQAESFGVQYVTDTPENEIEQGASIIQLLLSFMRNPQTIIYGVLQTLQLLMISVYYGLEKANDSDEEDDSNDSDDDDWTCYTPSLVAVLLSQFYWAALVGPLYRSIINLGGRNQNQRCQACAICCKRFIKISLIFLALATITLLIIQLYNVSARYEACVLHLQYDDIVLRVGVATTVVGLFFGLGIPSIFYFFLRLKLRLINRHLQAQRNHNAIH